MGTNPTGMLCATLLLVAGAGAVQAQVRAGDRVRITRHCDRVPCPREDGKLVSTPPDSIVVRTEASAHLAIPRAAIAQLELGHNRHGARIGAIVGGTVFGLFSGVMGGLVCSTMAWDPDSGCGGGVVVAMMAVGGLIGVGTGALLGTLIAPMQWLPLPPETVRIVISGLPDGRFGAGIRLAAPW